MCNVIVLIFFSLGRAISTVDETGEKLENQLLRYFLVLRNIQNCKFKSLNCNLYWLSLHCGASIFGKTTELVIFCRLLCIDFLIKSELNEFSNDNTNDDKNSIFDAEEKIISIQFDYRHVYAIQLSGEQAEMRLLRFAHSLSVAEIFFPVVPRMWTQNAVIRLNFILFVLCKAENRLRLWLAKREEICIIYSDRWLVVSVLFLLLFFRWTKRGNGDSIKIGRKRFIVCSV